MKRILRIGMDVHSTNYTLCAMEPIIGEGDRIFDNIQVTPYYKNIRMFIENLKIKLGLDAEYDIQCSYEAGCLGYSLYNQLTIAGVKCVILTPTTMLAPAGAACQDRCTGCSDDCAVPVLWGIPCSLYSDRGR